MPPRRSIPVTAVALLLAAALLPAGPAGEAAASGSSSAPDHVTVVAVVDTGINPYHDEFARPDLTMHPSDYIAGYPPNADALDLSLDEEDHDQAVQQDQATWDGLAPETLYWIPGTNIVGAIDKDDQGFLNSADDTTRILDDDGHGTYSAGAVTTPGEDVLIVAVEGTSGAVGWAADQPWIDVVSMSYGSYDAALRAAGGGVPSGIQDAWESGKLLVAAAGNEPVPDDASTPAAYPQVISVGGAHEPGHSEEPLASKTPDVVSSFTMYGLPDHDSTSSKSRVSGTSFAAPKVAGSLGLSILDLRRSFNVTEENTSKGFVHGVGASDGYLDDGDLDNHDVRDAMNRSAAYWSTTQYFTNELGVPIVPGAPWVQMGWGWIGPDRSDEIADVAAGDLDLTKPDAAHLYMGTMFDLRQDAMMGSEEPMDRVRDVLADSLELASDVLALVGGVVLDLLESADGAGPVLP